MAFEALDHCGLWHVFTADVVQWLMEPGATGRSGLAANAMRPCLALKGRASASTTPKAHRHLPLRLGNGGGLCVRFVHAIAANEQNTAPVPAPRQQRP